jgi:hypothetical protein
MAGDNNESNEDGRDSTDGKQGVSWERHNLQENTGVARFLAHRMSNHNVCP